MRNNGHSHYKCCVKYKKHLKNYQTLGKVLIEGFFFQQSCRLQAGKATDEKHFLMYFYGPS